MSTPLITDEGSFTKGTRDIINNGLGDCISPSAAVSVVSSTTLADITGMTTYLTPGTWTIDSDFSGTAGASGGWKIAFNYSNGLALSAISVTGIAYTASSVVFPNYVSSTTAQTAIISSTSAVTAGSIYGTLTVSTAGTLAVQFAQNASNATSSTIYTGTVAYLRKIA